MKGNERDRVRVCECVCMCVRVKEREHESETYRKHQWQMRQVFDDELYNNDDDLQRPLLFPNNKGLTHFQKTYRL